MPVGFEEAEGDNPGLAAAQPDAPALRLRFMFEKRGDMRFLSHLEVMRTFARAVQRAGLRVQHTQGFNPHPKIVFSHALPVGVESRAELVDIPILEIGGPLRLLDVFRKIQRALPKGLRPWAAWRLERGAPAAANTLAAAVYEITLPADVSAPRADEIESAVLGALAADSIEIERRRKGKLIRFDARPAILDFELTGPAQSPERALRLCLRYGEGAMPKVFDILAVCLGFSREECLRATVRKIGVKRRAGSSRTVSHGI